MGDVNRRHGKLYIRWYDGAGKRKQQATTCRTEKQARDLLREKEAEAQKVRDGRLAQPLGPTAEDKARRAITVRALAARFLGDVEGSEGYTSPRLHDLAEYRRQARLVLTVRLLPALGDRVAATLTPADVERLRDAELREGYSASSVMHTINMLSKLFVWARREGLVDCANPVQGVERPHSDPSLDFLAHAEASKLLATVEALARPGVASWSGLMLWPMVATAIYAGLRKGECFGLRWPDVALEAARIDVLHSYRGKPKGGKERHPPMHPEIVRALRWWKERCPSTPDALVFPFEGAPGRFRMAFRHEDPGLVAAFEMAGCHAPADGHRWHMLRHTFASHYMMAGGDLYALQRLLGHASPAMTQRYAHLATDHLAAEVARMTFAAPAPTGITDLGEERRKRAARDAEPGE